MPVSSTAHSPRVAQSRLATRSTASAVLAHFSRVLIVDDDAPLRRALSRFFRNASLDVYEAKSVAEALPLLDGEPDLVITDVRLPDGGGQRVVEVANMRRSAPVIVAMSGLDKNRILLNNKSNKKSSRKRKVKNGKQK
jgi:CheY-like chemotaxis protein